MAVERLEVQPADVVATDVLTAELRRLRRQQLRFNAGCFDEELLLARAFERDEQNAASSMLCRLDVNRPWFWCKTPRLRPIC